MEQTRIRSRDGGGDGSEPGTRHELQAGRFASHQGIGKPRLLVWLCVLFAGSVALAAWFLIGPAIGPGWYYRPGFGRGAYGYVNQVALLFVPYGLALWAWHRGARAPFWLLVGGAVLLHALVLFAPLPQSQDFYQYLFYGRMQAVHGANPMVVHPSLFRNDPWYVWIRWYSQPSVYGPVWTLISFGVVKTVGQSLASAFVGLKLVIFALDLGVMAMIAAAWRDRGDPDRGAWGILAYGWNPLILVSVPLAGASDIALAAAFLGAILARRRNHMLVTTALLTLAPLVKIYAVFGLLLHLVMLGKERGRPTVVRHVGVALAVAALVYAPYWAGLKTFSGLMSTIDLTNISLAGTVQLLLDSAFRAIGLPVPTIVAEVVVRAASIALFAMALVWTIRRVRDQDSMWQGLAFLMAAYLFLTPWSFYWYAVGLVVLVSALPRSRLTYPALAFSGTQLIAVRFRPVLAAWSVQSLLRYCPPVLLWLWAARRVGEERSRRRTAPVPVFVPRLSSRGAPAGE